MQSLSKWLSSKENIKIMVMVVLAIVLLFVMKIRLSGGNKATLSGPAAPIQKSIMEFQRNSMQRTNGGKGLKAETIFSKPMSADSLKPPPSLKRDIFSFRNSTNNSKRKTAEKALNDLELKAVIGDSEGAVAIIGEEVVGVGDFIKGAEVIAINNNEVILSNAGMKHVLGMLKE